MAWNRGTAVNLHLSQRHLHLTPPELYVPFRGRFTWPSRCRHIGSQPVPRRSSETSTQFCCAFMRTNATESACVNAYEGRRPVPQSVKRCSALKRRFRIEPPYLLPETKTY